MVHAPPGYLYTPIMPIDFTPGSLAAVIIRVLFWWTVVSPAALLAVAALCGDRPRLGGALTIVVLAPPLVTLMPGAVMSGGLKALAAAAGAAALAAALVLAVLGIVRARSNAGRSGRYAAAALLAGVAGAIVGSFALVGTQVVS
jgi:hypothetical protein